MYKKIIVLFLLLGTSIFVLPGETRAAEKSETTVTTNTLAASSAVTPQRYRRRWRNRGYYRRSSWNYGRYRRYNNRRNYRSYRRVYYTPYYRRNYRRYRNY